MGILYDLQTGFVKKRLSICKSCPLYYKPLVGKARCNSNLFLNPNTNDVSTEEKEGYISGCGCAIESKISDIDNSCPVGKW